MENENIITLQLQLTRRKALFLLTVFFLCWHPRFLGSEQLTLTTYYPAPYGGYANLLTTGQTLLARDAIGVNPNSKVGIGISGAPARKLDVNGDVNVGQTYLTNSDIYFNNTGHNHTGIGNTAGYAAIENASNYNTLMLLGRANGIGGVRSVSVWDRLDVNGAMFVNGDISVSGNFLGTLKVCTKVSFGVQALPTSCPVGKRVISHWGPRCPTAAGLIYSKLTGGDYNNAANWQPYYNNECTGEMLCCTIGY